MDGLLPAMPDATTAPRGVLFDVAPLLTPYGQHRSLALRIELLPEGARLSRGHNNGDHTWSLKPDDLDGLVYLPPPDNMHEAHTLAVRIISLDSDSAATLAMLDFPISPGAAQPWVSPDLDAEPSNAASAAVEEALLEAKIFWEADRAAHDRVEAQARATLEERLSDLSRQLETALADADAAYSREIERLMDRHADALRRQETEAEARIARELAALSSAVKAASEKELDERISLAVREGVEKPETEAGARLEQAQRDWQAESEGELTAATTRCAQVEAELEEVRSRTDDRQLAEDALLEAKRTWEVEEAARLVAAQAQWRERSAKDLEDATERLRSEWETISAMDRAAHDSAEAQSRDELAQALAAATARFERAELALEETRAQAEAVAVKNVGGKTELDAFRDELEGTRTTLVHRETELALTRAALDESRKTETAYTAHNKELDERLSEAAKNAEWRLDEARELWEAETEVALAKAKKVWQAGEAGRLAAARVEWQEHARLAKTSTAVSVVVKSRRRALATRRLIRAGVVAACVVAAVMFYPRIEPIASGSWWPRIVGLKGEIDPLFRKAENMIKFTLAELASAPVARAIIDVDFANVRMGPSTATTAVMTLRRDMEVTLLERRGNWARIRIDRDDGKQGWVHSSLLKSAVDR